MTLLQRCSPDEHVFGERTRATVAAAKGGQAGLETVGNIVYADYPDQQQLQHDHANGKLLSFPTKSFWNTMPCRAYEGWWDITIAKSKRRPAGPSPTLLP